jgi:hypothetical protein
MDFDSLINRVPVSTKRFDGARDVALIAQGGHFYCHGHLCAVPRSEQSIKNAKYCKDCQAVLDQERKTNGPADCWEPGNMVFVHYDRRYAITASGNTTVLEDKACQVDADGPQHKPDNSDGCSKLIGGRNYQGKSLPQLVTDEIKALLVRGLSTRAIAGQTGVSNATVWRIKRGLTPDAPLSKTVSDDQESVR